MLRRLLTLLALVTGLAATGAHAELRMAALQDVRLEAVDGQRTIACAAATQATQGDLGQALRTQPEERNYCPMPATMVVIPAVYIGVDRARE